MAVGQSRKFEFLEIVKILSTRTEISHEIRRDSGHGSSYDRHGRLDILRVQDPR